jgi:hypothetical protein
LRIPGRAAVLKTRWRWWNARRSLRVFATCWRKPGAASETPSCSPVKPASARRRFCVPSPRGHGTGPVFEGRCDELITPRTLGPFRDMARHHRRVFGDVIDDRDAFIDVLTAEMGFRQRPAVVIVEDLQWADHASLDIVGFLGRRVHALPALLVVSYRDDDVPDNEPLQRLLGSLTGDSTTRIHLDGLSDAAVGGLAIAFGMDPAPVESACASTSSATVCAMRSIRDRQGNVDDGGRLMCVSCRCSADSSLRPLRQRAGRIRRARRSRESRTSASGQSRSSRGSDR